MLNDETDAICKLKNKYTHVIKSLCYLRCYVDDKSASSYFWIARNKLAFIVWHDRSRIDTGTCSALESFQSSVTVDFLRQRFALTRILLLPLSTFTPADPSGPSPFSSSATTPLSSCPPYLHLSIFFFLHSRHAYVCTKRIKGTERGEKLYRELLRGVARWVRCRCKEKILNIALGRVWLSTKWLR